KAIFDFGDAEAVLPADEQIPKQFLRANSFVKTLILRVEGNEKKCEIILSRSHPEFLKQLLADEVPEIKEGVVEIVKAVRQPGIRSKVLVKSLKEHVDPVGTCVGVRGSRIKTIISELGGEKIDLVDAAKNPAAIVASSLSPARVESSSVKINKLKKKAVVTIDPSQRGQALGQGGFNINLASELTGMEIDIEFGEKELSDTAESGTGDNLKTPPGDITPETANDGITPKTADLEAAPAPAAETAPETADLEAAAEPATEDKEKE
ncbi:MAG: transcription termination/antitermination protein NusA, partial [Elusimicrobiota bacterium]|nr:transcription termination/antitermination protein NusA [Elusimicrobiota bacterium]